MEFSFNMLRYDLFLRSVVSAPLLLFAEITEGQSIQDPPGVLEAIYFSEVLLGDTYNSGLEVRRNLGEVLKTTLNPVFLGDEGRMIREWNNTHPLMAIPDIPRSPLSGVSVEANVALISEIASISPVAAQVFAGALLLPYSEMDYKRRSGLIVDLQDAIDFGNFNAGALAYASGVSESRFVTLADAVQHLQDAIYTLDDLTSDRDIGIVLDRLGQRFGGDDARGREFAALGRSWAMATDYRFFLLRTMEVADRSVVEDSAPTFTIESIAPSPQLPTLRHNTTADSDWRLWREWLPEIAQGKQEPDSSSPTDVLNLRDGVPPDGFDDRLRPVELDALD